MFLGSTKLLGARHLWKASALPKIKFFSWLAIHNRCWTTSQRKKRGLRECDLYALCHQAPETWIIFWLVVPMHGRFGQGCVCLLLAAASFARGDGGHSVATRAETVTKRSTQKLWCPFPTGLLAALEVAQQSRLGKVRHHAGLWLLLAFSHSCSKPWLAFY